MAYIFLDESGDLGFNFKKKKTSKVFVITCLLVENKRPVEKIVIKTPHEEKSLQAVDFVSWAIFRKYEYGDDSYYNLIKNKIVEEKPLFP